MRSLLPLAAALLAALTAVGCGYRAGLSPQLPDGREARTLGIEIFGNETLLPNLEQPLHRATSDSARRFLDLELSSPRRADLVLRGSIKDFQRRDGARTPDNLFVETREVVLIEAALIDRARGVEVARTQVETVVGTAIDVPGREPEQRERALRIAAERIVLELVADLEHRGAEPAWD